MQADKTSIVDVLNAVPAYRELYEEARNKAVLLESACTKMTTQPTGMPPSGTADRDALLAKLIDAHDEVYDRAEKLIECTKRVKDFVNASPLGDTEKTIILLRYISNYPWREILANCGGISERQMYYVHNEALTQLTEYYQHGEFKELDYINENW